ncbi:MAG: RES family NAD+ phosphorylase [Alphaproteobacteria bacterium]
MALEKGLIDKLQLLESETWRGTVYRHMLGDRDPLLPNTRGARWNPPGVDALYSSLERATALTEGAYLIAAQPVPLRVKRVLHRIRVTLRSVIRLSDAALLRKLGIDDLALANADHSACRKVGQAAAWLEHDGLIVPSARATGLNLVVFVNNQEIEPEAIDSETIEDPAP